MHWSDLRRRYPLREGAWDRDRLKEYLIQLCHTSSNEPLKRFLHQFFSKYRSDEALADLLFAFLLDDSYDGSDCQMGAAQVIASLDRDLLRKKRELLLLAQQNEVYWKRPFPPGKDLSWL